MWTTSDTLYHQSYHANYGIRLSVRECSRVVQELGQADTLCQQYGELIFVPGLGPNNRLIEYQSISIFFGDCRSKNP